MISKVIEMKKEIKGYDSPGEALQDGCRMINLPEAFVFCKELPGGRTFQQVLLKSRIYMEKPVIIPAPAYPDYSC